MSSELFCPTISRVLKKTNIIIIIIIIIFKTTYPKICEAFIFSIFLIIDTILLFNDTWNSY